MRAELETDCLLCAEDHAKSRYNKKKNTPMFYKYPPRSPSNLRSSNGLIAPATAADGERAGDQGANKANRVSIPTHVAPAS